MSHRTIAALILVWLVPLALPARAQTFWEESPYRLRIVVAVEPSPWLSPAFEEQLIASIQMRTESLAGAALNAQLVAAPPKLRYAMTRRIEAFTSPAEIGDAAGEKIEKELLLGVRARPDGVELVAREFDTYIQRWGPTRRRITRQDAALADDAWSLLWEAFTPLGKVAVSRDQSATMRMRACGLIAAGSPLSIPAPGDVFQPILRRNDRAGIVIPGGIIPLPWTMLVVESTEGTSSKLKVEAGVRRPLDVARRARTDLFGLAVRREEGSTRVLLRSRTDETRPLEGYEMLAKPPAGKDWVFLGYTDGRGAIDVPATDEPLRLVSIKHGNQILGRIPLAPGVMPEITVTIPDDDVRLRVEGLISDLRGEMIDVAAQREVFGARIHGLLDEEKGDKKERLTKMETLLDQLKKLPSRTDFTGRFEEIKKVGQVKDSSVQRQIDALIQDSQEMLNRYMAKDPVDQIQAAVDEFRKKGK